MDKKERINELVVELNKANRAYYQESREIMSNLEYDKLYDELLMLESDTGYSPDNSPTKNVGYQIVSALNKVTHEYPALSLDKTKDRSELKEWLNQKAGVLSWKLDGLTIQLTYDDGKLTRAVTRGNGEVGEDVTHNAVYFKGVPKEIDFKQHFVCRGEALISYKTFEKINQLLKPDEQYKNPRNLASGSARQLDAKAAAARGIEFKAFELVLANGKAIPTYADSFDWMKTLGFDVVEYERVNPDNLLERIEYLEETIVTNDFPSDGLVLSYDDIAYGKSLGTTGKFPKHSIAFKWADGIQETILTDIEWSASRTGLINPVAVFEPVELEGTTVSRASVHNVSIVESLKLGAGDNITVYKANMIIPQIAENITKSGTAVIPQYCPVCGSKTTIKETTNNGQTIKTLYCINLECQAKQIKKFAHFVERDRMNISGLSEATLEKLIGEGFIKEFKDIYHLDAYKEKIVKMEGFGEKSYEKLAKAIDKSKTVKLENLIAALGIENVGRDAGKKISKALGGDIDRFNEKLETGYFLDVKDVGELSNNAISAWYQKQKLLNNEGKSEYFNLLKEIEVIIPKKKETSEKTESLLGGKKFVITGSLNLYASRAELIEKIEFLGGSASGSVSAKTDYLINNDTTSNSSKNKKAKEAGVSIITEEEFMKLLER